MKNRIYFIIQTNNIQSFFAILWYAERNPEAIYIIDKNNELLLNRVKNLITIKVEKFNIEKVHKEVLININHELPTTVIDGNMGKLFFPDIIHNNFQIDPKEKIKKVFFGGNFTKIRFLESLKFFFRIQDFKAIIQLFSFVFILQKREFKIETSKIDFCFTNNGRNPTIKFLDTDYYQNLSRYKFIFCPQGIYEWTYRFYEAILVNSVPVIDFKTETFGEFEYIKSNHLKTVDDRILNKIINHNLHLIKDGKVL